MDMQTGTVPGTQRLNKGGQRHRYWVAVLCTVAVLSALTLLVPLQPLGDDATVVAGGHPRKKRGRNHFVMKHVGRTRGKENDSDLASKAQAIWDWLLEKTTKKSDQGDHETTTTSDSSAPPSILFSVPPALASVFTYGAPLAAQVVFFSSLDTMRQFAREKSTGGVSPLPYSMMTANGVLWMCYGGLLSDPTIFFANLSGFVMGLYYLRTFSKYMDPSVKLTGYLYLSGGLIVFCLATTFHLDKATAVQVLGLAGCGVVITMFGGPLEAIRTVIKERNAASLPLSFTLATIINCTLWAGYGAAVTGDIFVWGPNMLGLASGLVQLALIYAFGRAGTPKLETSTPSKHLL
eukprot:g52375.t1